VARTWVTDARDFLDEAIPLAQLPPSARRMIEHLRAIVGAASVRTAGRAAPTEVRCRPKRRACPGFIHVLRTEVPAEIHWSCAACAENGVIRGWQGSQWDLSRAGGMEPPESGRRSDRRTRAPRGTPDAVYQLEIRLLDVEPPIWRRVQVPADMSLARLHGVIQTAMGWTDSHLHVFEIGDARYGVPDPEYDLEMRDERRVSLRDLVADTAGEFLYEYDFGDSWWHAIRVEEVLPADPKERYPRCIGGARACPPEDAGGTPGYAELLRALDDPEHPEREEYLLWAGEDFDPEDFDAEAVNRSLRRRARR